MLRNTIERCSQKVGHIEVVLSIDTWNLRDHHMADTLFEIVQHVKHSYHLPRSVKAAVWAHNSHVGDASATESSNRGEVNIGQLVRFENAQEN